MEFINPSVFDVLDSIPPQVAFFGTVFMCAALLTFFALKMAYKKRGGEDE